MSAPERSAREVAIGWLMPGLPWLVLVFMPFSRRVDIPVLTMTALALWLLLTRRLDWSAGSPVRTFSLVFGFAWLAMAISLLDAVEPLQSLRVLASHLRLYLAGLFVIYALSSREALARFLQLCAWLIVFWIVDALYQWATGVDLFGQGHPAGRITGLYGPRSAKFGIVLAVLAPLLLEHARRCWPRWALLLAAAAALLVVFVGGTRAAWLAAMAIAGAYWVVACLRLGRIPWRATFAGLALAGVLVAGATAVSNSVAERFNAVVSSFEGEMHRNIFHHRGWIWMGAWNMFVAHPVNGVGVRGFRYAFPDHTEAGDPFMALDPPLLPTHPHHYVLEILTETGLVGLLAALIGATVLIGASIRAPPEERWRILPFALGLLGLFWPLNTHPALFSANWSVLTWWLIALYCAACATAIGAGRRDSAVVACESG